MRYLPHTDTDIKQMLATIGVADTNVLFSGIPADCRLSRPMELPPGLAEADILKELRDLAANGGRPSDQSQ